MSSIMITEDENFADEKDAFAVIKSENVVTVPGLGFTETVIIDQHFIRRKRRNRLISLVIENPKKIGIGIDESTAAVFYPGQTLEIIGDRNVIIYDASGADVKMGPGLNAAKNRFSKV
jgi:cyanophycinase